MAPIRIPSGSYSTTSGLPGPSSGGSGNTTGSTATGGATWDYILKFILIGDSSVGKSSLLVRLTDDRFLTDPDPTIGVEFGSHLITLDNRETVKLQVWDTAGSESFRSITRSYYRGAAGALLVYDVTHRASFLNAKAWLDDVRSHAEERVTIVLVGNMSDLVDDDDDARLSEVRGSIDLAGGGAGGGGGGGVGGTDGEAMQAPTRATMRARSERRRSKGKKREVSTYEARTFAEQEGLLFLETSAKTGHNVQEAFTQAAKDIHSKFATAGAADAGGSLGRNARSRARNGRAAGTVALDAAGSGEPGTIPGGDAASRQDGTTTYTDRTAACCTIA